MTAAPSREVLDGFGAGGHPIPLDGGQGVTFRVDGLVLKRVHDVSEAAWTQALLSRVVQDGFRIPRPVPAVDGRWVHRGWSASRFVEGLRRAAPSWDEIAAAGLRFAAAGELVRDGGREILAHRTHRWAVADRVAWEEAQLALGAEASEVRDRISVWLDDPSNEEHLVHGDLSGNVYIDQSGTPVILDVSPYLRPRRWAVAIVIVDAVLWNGANVSLAESFASDPTNRDLFGRALIFRLVAEQLAVNHLHEDLLKPYCQLLTTLT